MNEFTIMVFVVLGLFAVWAVLAWFIVKVVCKWAVGPVLDHSEKGFRCMVRCPVYPNCLCGRRDA